ALATLIAVGVSAGRETTGQDKPGATLEQDRKKLEGVWRTDDWGKEGAKGWQCHAAVSLKGLEFPQLSLSIKFEGADQKSGIAYTARAEVKEKDGKRSIAVDPDVVKSGGAHAAIYYRFDGESLILRLQADQGKGEYKLQRVKKD